MIPLLTFDYKGETVARIDCSSGELCEQQCRIGTAIVRLSEIQRAQDSGDNSRLESALTHNGGLCPTEASLQASRLVCLDVHEELVS